MVTIRKQLKSANRKGYILVTTLLIVMFIVLLAQMLMANIFLVSNQSRLFVNETRQRLDIKSEIYQQIAIIENNHTYSRNTFTAVGPNGNRLSVWVRNIFNNTSEDISMEKVTVYNSTLLAVAWIYCHGNKCIIYRWEWRRRQ